MPTSENITGEAQALALAVERRAQQAYQALLAKLDEGVDPRLAIAQVQKSFDGEFAGELAQAFSTVLQRSVSVGSVLAMPVGEVVLSRRLWALNGEMVNQVSGLIRQHAQGLQSAQTLARQLYDGYNPIDGVQRPLEGAARAKLPKALQALTSTPQTRESLARVLEQGQQLAARIKSETLKAGYLEAVQAWVDGEGKQALNKRLWVAQREKNRYTADRIAQTELARAHQAKVGQEFMADGSISVVQVRINPAHPVTDICDLHARADLFGLGAGCYPKAKAPRPPFHPHCACRLSSRPDLMAGADTAERKGAVQAYLKSLPAYEAARVMGSKERLLDVMQRGKSVDAVVNAGRDPMYHLARLGGMEIPASSKAEQFAKFFNNDAGAPPRFSIATLTPEDQALFGVRSPDLWLSRASLDEHMGKHPGVGMSDYLKIPEIVRNADVWGGHQDRRFLLLSIGEKAYRAAIKAAEDHSTAWFLSLVISPKQKPPKGAVLLRKGAGGSGWRP